VGVNTGAFIAPFISGTLGEKVGYHWGFGAAAVGMFFGILWYLSGWKHLGDVGMEPAKPGSENEGGRNRLTLMLGLGVTALLIVVVWMLSKSGALVITPEKVARVFGTVLAFTPLVLFPWMYFTGGYTAQEKKQLIVIMVLFFGATVFWGVFEQAASTLNLFADRNTDLTITTPFALAVSAAMAIPAFLVIRWYAALTSRRPGQTGFMLFVVALVGAGIWYLVTHRGQGFQSSQYQALNSMFIVAIAPLFAALWVGLGSREPSSPAKFAIGLFFVAAGFAILILASKAAMAGVKVSPVWLVGTYLLHTVGELCLSPVGLSAMTRLAPQRIVGMVLGIWFLATSLGNFLAGLAGSMSSSTSLSTLFAVVTGVALVATLVMAALVGPIKRMLERA
jgi:POT family proton-dependent oligopeptide transporter